MIITGLSGSGKSTALRAFEDLGYFCVDNLPVALLPAFLEIKSREPFGPNKVALVMDLREEGFLRSYREVFARVRREGHHLEVIFLEASDEVLIARYSQTRRPHPLAPRGSLSEAVRLEREALQEVREVADLVLDTSGLNVHQLRREIRERFAPRQDLAELTVHFVSFGFKHGVPAEAHLVFDVRFLPNPYFDPALRPLDGRREEVSRFALENEVGQRFLGLVEELLRFLLPHYEREGKSYLVICVGCTGGRHRSVAVAEALARVVKDWGHHTLVTHRDLHKEA